MTRNRYGVECIGWTLIHPQATYDMLGYVPNFLSKGDPRPAKKQMDEGYKQYGGWQPMDGFRFDPKTRRLKYPGDPALRLIAEFKRHNETVLFYEGEWFLITQSDGSFEIARLN